MFVNALCTSSVCANTKSPNMCLGMFAHLQRCVLRPDWRKKRAARAPLGVAWGNQDPPSKILTRFLCCIRKMQRACKSPAQTRPAACQRMPAGSDVTFHLPSTQLELPVDCQQQSSSHSNFFALSPPFGQLGRFSCSTWCSQNICLFIVSAASTPSPLLQADSLLLFWSSFSSLKSRVRILDRTKGANTFHSSDQSMRH